MRLRDIHKISNKKIVKKFIENNHLDNVPKLYLNNVLHKFYNTQAITIQKYVRRFLEQRNYRDLLITTYFPTKTYRNDETLLGDKIEEIEEGYFISVDGYAFDVREIYKNRFKNPYTNLLFNTAQRIQIHRIIRQLICQGYSMNFVNTIPDISQLTTLKSNFLTKLSENNTYPSTGIFMGYHCEEIYFYMRFILKFRLIDRCLDRDDIRRLYDLYYSMEYYDDEAKEHSEFLFYAMTLLNKIIDLDIAESDVICLILSEAIVADIYSAYRNREYIHISQYYE